MKTLAGFIAALLCSGMLYSQTVFINEIHYDNTGTDMNEGIGIAGPAGTDLSCYTLYPYNGSGGAPYSPTTVLSGTIDDEGCGYGELWFPILGLQNGAPDGIVLYNSCTATVVHFLSYEGTPFTATSGVANGMTSTDVGVSEGSGTAVGHSLQLSGTGTTYTDFSWTGPSAGSAGSLNSGQNFCSCTVDTEPTGDASNISFSAVGCNGLTINWTNGNGSNRIVVVREGAAVAGTPTDQSTYTANTVFGSGNTIAANEYVVFNGSGSSVTISNLTNNTTYHVAIFEYNGTTCEENYLTSSPLIGSQLTTTCICPYMTGLVINACQGSCNEGDNEMVFLNSGSFSITVNTSNVNFLYGSSNPAATNYTDAFTTNAAAITDMDAAAGCPGLFIDAVNAGTIPAGSPFMIVSNAICASSAYDFSSFCGNGPVYVIFSTDANWMSPGNFANSPSCSGGTRYMRTDFSNNDPSCVIDYSFDCSNNTNTDGDFATYASTGGTPVTHSDDDCSPTIAVLPVELTLFEATAKRGDVFLNWQTASELNNDYFLVEKSSDAIHFESISLIHGAGTSSSTNNYQYIDPFPFVGVTYYRLTQVDLNGVHTHLPIKSVRIDHNEGVGIQHISSQNDLLQLHYFANDADEPLILDIIDVYGKVVHQETIQTNPAQLPMKQLSLARGIYMIRLSDGITSDVKKFKY